MLIILPVSLYADDAVAMLRGPDQGVLVNHNPAPASIALFADDLVETTKNTAAKIESTGSTTDVSPETVVMVEANELVLDHGTLFVNTVRGLRVRVGCITITPVNPAEETQYQVVDLDGKVTVSAIKDDVYIDEHSKKAEEIKKPEHSNRALVRQGEQKSREEKCAGAYLRTPPGHYDALGAIMNSPYAIAVGLGGVGVIACLGLLCKNDDPVSPSKP